MAKSIFEIVFDHCDACARCDPSGYPLCPDGAALLKAATEMAGKIVAPIPEIPRSEIKA